MMRLWKWYFERKKNDFETMCDKIEENVEGKLSTYDPIIYTRYHVSNYVKEDINKLLKIKAEANSISYNEYIVSLLTITGTGATILGIIADINKSDFCLKGYILLSLIVFLFIWKIGSEKFKNVRKWQSYIIVTIEELEIGMKTNTNHK